MAILSNGKFYGFLCSVKETGRKLANGVKEYAEDFVSGFAGHGWKLWEYIAGKWKLEIDTIVVRETMLVFEMLISKIRAIIGAQTISQGHGKVKSARISDDGTEYLIELEDEDVSIVAHDFVRCQTFVGDKTKLYHVEVLSVDVETKTLHVPLSEFDKDESGNVLNVPAAGDELVQFGNSQNKARQSAIYMHADETGQPAIDVMFDLNSKNWEGKVKVRVGGDIPGSGGLKGFYCVNGMIKGVDSKGNVAYCIYPDGTAELGCGAALFKPDKSGHIAGGAIEWIWDESNQKCVCTMKDVVLTWDNLSDDAKENLKGEPGKNGADGNNGQDGKDGYDGIDGADGENGKDGISLVYKGELSSHPDNAENGWYYRNTTDKKSYVYQDDAWYVMTVDGLDGQDGNDGLDIVWKGDSSISPANPQKNWVYRDTDNGRVYIYNGAAWELMVADGNDGIDGTDGEPGTDGKDGMRVYITYHDSEEEPEIPVGDGTTEGWHTNSTASVVWISQKVAENAESGEWGDPIRVNGESGKDGQDANLLPWIEKWNGYATELGEEYIVTPKMFSGTKTVDSEGKVLLTGIVQGKDCLTAADGTTRTGIFALVDNEIVFALDPILKEYLFTGQIKIADDKILLDQDGSGHLANGNIKFTSDGSLSVKGYIQESYQLLDSRAGMGSLDNIHLAHDKIILNKADNSDTSILNSTLVLSDATDGDITVSALKLELYKPILFSLYNMTNRPWCISLDSRNGNFSIVSTVRISTSIIYEERNVLDIYLVNGTNLDLMFLPTSIITVNVGSKKYNYYKGTWMIKNRMEFRYVSIFSRNALIPSPIVV